MLPACLMAFDRFIIKPNYADIKHAKLNAIHKKKLSIPKLTDLQKQRLALREQLKQNRIARIKALIARIKKLTAKTSKEEKNNEDKK